ncbi:MAG TPA: hypothetical protein VGM37_19420 [Armatimonadota bacterium]|jgi:hypothetical protein
MQNDSPSPYPAPLHEEEVEGLSLESQDRLVSMEQEMRRRGLPETMIVAGLRSTAMLLLEREAADTPRIRTESVQRFLEENSGVPVARGSQEAPLRETKARNREQLHEMVQSLLSTARGAHRRHEILKARRDLMGLDQSHIRRTLGAEGAAMCGEINAWLLDAAMKLDRG